MPLHWLRGVEFAWESYVPTFTAIGATVTKEDNASNFAEKYHLGNLLILKGIQKLEFTAVTTVTRISINLPIVPTRSGYGAAAIDTNVVAPTTAYQSLGVAIRGFIGFTMMPDGGDFPMAEGESWFLEWQFIVNAEQ